MAHETIDGTYRQTNLTNESAEYLAKREASTPRSLMGRRFNGHRREARQSFRMG